MGKKYKVVFDIIGCIGAYTCVAANPKHWEINANEGKATFLGSTKNEKSGNYELIIDEEDLKANLDAARVCPVNVIHIFDLETGKELI